MKRVTIPSILTKMNSYFSKAGFKAYLVGGAVRDSLLKQNVSDYDLATDAKPDQVMKIFQKVIPTGIEHGTVTVLFMGQQIEVTTFRIESDYSDSRHPDSIEYTSDICKDLSRRDFTINAMAASLETGEIIDPFDGQLDLQRKIIRTVGNPIERFMEDGLRPIRAIRFSTKLNFEIEQNTYDAINQCISKTKTISIERFRDELCKMIHSEKPSRGFKLMEATGLLELFIPELLKCRNLTQADCRGFHQFDVLDHLFYACDGAPSNNEQVRLAALFHDIGKADCRKIEEKEINGKIQTIYTFFNHEVYSAKVTKQIMTRLKFPNNEIDYVCNLISQHMFNYTQDWTDAAIRRFLTRVKPEMLDDLFDLRLADVYGMTNTKPILKNGRWSENLLEFRDRLDLALSQKNVFCLKDLAVNGNDLINIGITNGKQIGYILNELLQTVLDCPSDNEKEKLLAIAKKINSQLN